MTRWHWQSVLACPIRRDGHDAAGNPGDCFRTALADLLELDPAAVPNFVLYLSWHDEARRFVRAATDAATDLVYLEPNDPWEPLYGDADNPRYVLGTVQSPRGPYFHTVVLDARTGLVVHDPHPLGRWRHDATTPYVGEPARPDVVGVHALCPFWQGESLDPLRPRLALPRAS